MLINEGEDIFLGKDGKTTDTAGDGATLLVARGGRIDEATATRHKLKGRLTPESEVTLKARHTGDEYVLVDGRAVAKSLIEPPPSEADADEAEAESNDEPARAIPAAEAKSIAGPQENKGGPVSPKKADQHKAADKD